MRTLTQNEASGFFGRVQGLGEKGRRLQINAQWGFAVVLAWGC